MATTESSASFMNYFSRRGHAQRGDEPTDNFSDDEGEQDTTALKRERRERVKVVNATKSSIVHRAVNETPGFKNAQVSVPSLVDSQGRVGVALTGVNRVDEDTMRKVRNIDRSSQSEVVMTELNYTNHETQTNVQGMGAKLTFNALHVLDRYADSQKWKRDLIIMCVALGGGSFLVYYTFGSLVSYLF
jgi:hypothetical protein